jgi:broad specificity phosphatase PhoE
MPGSPRASAPRLLLIRHAESVIGRAQRYAGHRDTPLSPRGRAQAARLRARIGRFRPDLLVSSDLKRCLETAELAAPGAAILATERLRELDFGSWDGLSARTCRRRDARRFDRWMRDPWSTRPPGGESLRQLWIRVRRYVGSLLRRFPRRTLAIVTHAGPIRALLAPHPSRFWSVDVPPAAVFAVDRVPARGRARERRCAAD